ncbi:CYTH domain-containing protein [Bacillus marasmi]|uniref:CYTH domain-containing protein n=1 Tax=Bacillus marasmi TaxID=1926279 RepID=UPI00164DE821|nr:CYTH domain-containing protein [Bacillus marasmi]
MSQQIEIEYKNLLSKEEYERLQDYFKIDQSSIKKQINHYFDTSIFALKNLHSALRIREKGGKYELTLKQPAEIGLLETNQILTKEVAKGMLDGGKLPDGPVKTALLNVGFAVDTLEFFGTLTTYRAELEFEGGILVLDHSQYLKVEDFEVEYEVTDPEQGKVIFQQLLTNMHIPLRKTDNKIQRFYQQKYKS